MDRSTFAIELANLRRALGTNPDKNDDRIEELLKKYNFEMGFDWDIITRGVWWVKDLEAGMIIYTSKSVTPIEPPPEPLRRIVYIPVYKTGHGLGATSPVSDGTINGYASTGEEARRRTSGFEHRVGIIKVELVEGQYDE